jgi:DNA-directed RNA polymerase subunit beta
MNLGQILETHLGMAARKLGYKVATPVLDGVHEHEIKEQLEAGELLQFVHERIIQRRRLANC